MIVVQTSRETMPAVAVHPGKAHSLHLTELPVPAPGPGEVLVRVKRVGVCGTDQEIIEASFGSPPPGADWLVLGHEVLGQVEATGQGVTGWQPGDLVTNTVRRAGDCTCDPCLTGQTDMCTGHRYTEFGIIGRHGFMTHAFVEEPERLVRVPAALEQIGILVEPLSVVEKAWQQATLIQGRIPGWAPKTALVLGAGPIGLLGTLLLRSHGLEVTTVARRAAPSTASTIITAAGGRYASVREHSLAEITATMPSIDIIFEAAGNAHLSFDAMRLLGNNGVYVLLSLTPDAEDTVPVGAINREWVLGNKVLVGSVNSSKEHFEMGVTDLQRFEALWPGLASRLITRRLHGFKDWQKIVERETDGVKTVIEVE